MYNIYSCSKCPTNNYIGYKGTLDNVYCPIKKYTVYRLRYDMSYVLLRYTLKARHYDNCHFYTCMPCMPQWCKKARSNFKKREFCLH